MLIKNFVQVYSLLNSIDESLGDTATVNLTKEALVSSLPTLGITYDDLNDPNVWNFATGTVVRSLSALYKQIDHSYNQVSLVRENLVNKIKTVEGFLKHGSLDLYSLLSLSESGYQVKYTGFDLPNFTRVNQMYLPVFDPNEFFLTTPKTVSLSLNKNNGFFAGSVFIRRHTGNLINSNPESIVDSNLNTFWDGIVISKSPIKTSASGDAWVTPIGQNKANVLIDFILNRPTTFNTLTLNTAESVVIEKVSWSKTSIPNSLHDPTMENLSTGKWVYTGTGALDTATLGYGGSVNCVRLGPGVGSVRQRITLNSLEVLGQALSLNSDHPLASGTITVSTPIPTGTEATGNIKINGTTYAYTSWSGSVFTLTGTTSLAYVAGTNVYADTGPLKGTYGLVTQVASPTTDPKYLIGSRAEFSFFAKGNINNPFKVIIRWLDSAGTPLTINEYTEKHKASSSYNEYTVVDYVPSDDLGNCATSVDVKIAYEVAGDTAGSYLYLDQFSMKIGEGSFVCHELIEGYGSLSLPHTINTDRISVILSKELGELEEYTPPVIEGGGQYYPRWFQAQLENKLKKGTYLFYKFPIQEIDFIYNQYVNECAFITKEKSPPRETRNVSYTIQANDLTPDNVSVRSYPVSGNTSIFKTLTGKQGSYAIITTEEEALGWASPVNDNTLIVKPQRVTEVYDGTDLSGKIKLDFVPHVSRVKVGNIHSWLDLHYGYKLDFDANVSRYYGLKSTSFSQLSTLQSKGIYSVNLELSDIETYEGYRPIEITIENEGLTAIPDTNGKPNIYTTSIVVDETLEEVTYHIQEAITANNSLTFDQWISLISLRDYLSISQYKEQIKSALTITNLDLSLKEAISSGVLGGLQNLVLNDFNQKTSSKIGVESALVEVIQVEKNAYKSALYPIEDSSESVQITLHDTVTMDDRVLNSGEYQVFPDLGIIKLTTQILPANAFTVKANYKPINKYNKFLNTSWLKITDLSYFNSNLKLPVTRNMTDYVNQTIPVLKNFNNDVNSKDYYPVIEYYVGEDGEIQFTREFSNYGAMKSKITVSYETLKLKVSSKVTLSSGTLAPKLFSVKAELS